LFKALASEAANEYTMLDSTIVCATCYWHSTGAYKKRIKASVAAEVVKYEDSSSIDAPGNPTGLYYPTSLSSIHDLQGAKVLLNSNHYKIP